jgi:hypothetical protein
MTRKITLVIIFIFMAGLILTYFTRGGMVKPVITKVETQPFTMIATTYKGKGKDKALREIIRQTHEYMEKGQLKGALAIVYQGNPDSRKDSINILVGVMTEDTTKLQLPEKYYVTNIPTMRTVRAELKAHVSVAPNPEKVNEMLVDFARKSGLTLDSIYIEKYFSAEHIVSEIKVK